MIAGKILEQQKYIFAASEEKLSLSKYTVFTFFYFRVDLTLRS